MDRIIAAQAAIEDRDLMLCLQHGVAYQRLRSHLVSYDGEYFAKYLRYEGQEIARKINAGRIDLVNRHVGAAGVVVDIGVGSGEFIKLRPRTFGYDVNPVANAWLRQEGLSWTDLADKPAGFSFWDVIEHVDEPECYFRQISEGAYLFTCLPIFGSLMSIRDSKHYRPGEHLYYWTERGFVAWMTLHGFNLTERADFEIAAGRDSILSFAFRRG